MERLRQMILPLWLGLLAGCHPLQLCPWKVAPAGGSSGPVCKVVATWSNQVAYSPDPVNGGAPTPGLAGRVYLFDQSIGHPLAGDGSLVVDLYHADADVNNGRPVPLEQWRFDPDTMKRLLRKDTIGQGYTLFLPWGTYRPDINRVAIKVCYQPARGTPLYSDTSLLTLQSDRKDRTVAARPTPASAKPPGGASDAQ